MAVRALPSNPRKIKNTYCGLTNTTWHRQSVKIQFSVFQVLKVIYDDFQAFSPWKIKPLLRISVFLHVYQIRFKQIRCFKQHGSPVQVVPLLLHGFHIHRGRPLLYVPGICYHKIPVGNRQFRIIFHRVLEFTQKNTEHIV